LGAGGVCGLRQWPEQIILAVKGEIC